MEVTSETASPKPSEEPAKEAVKYNDYSVSLEINPESRIVNGAMKVTYENKSGFAIDNIYFNLYLNAFSSSNSYKPYFSNFERKIFREGKDYGYIHITDATVNSVQLPYETKGTVLSLKLGELLKPGEGAEIGITFEAYVPMINHRTGANGSAMYFGNFLPSLAVYDQEGWHTDPYYPAGDPFYTDISNYSVRITTPPGYIVCGTGEESAVETGDKRVTTITAKLVRDFAFALSKEYKIKTIKSRSGAYVNMYYYSDIKNLDDFMDSARESLNFYSGLLGAYPYSSFDIVETGLFLEGGMEYPGLAFIDSDYLKKPNAIDTIVHEIGHQWFYNIIGNNQIKEAWLDEGLTSYLQLLYKNSPEEIRKSVEKSYGELSLKLPVMEEKSLLADLSAYESWNDYYSIQYTRAKLMFYALSQKMGPEKFNEFLKAYYGKYSFATADKKGFVHTAEEIYGGSLSSFFYGWMESDTLPDLK